jgi:hypothetical protein
MTKLHNSIKVFRQDRSLLIHDVEIGRKLLVISEEYFHYQYAYSRLCYTPESLRAFDEHYRAAAAWCRASLGMGAMGKGQTVYRGRPEFGFPMKPMWNVNREIPDCTFSFKDANHAVMFKMMFG